MKQDENVIDKNNLLKDSPVINNNSTEIESQSPNGTCPYNKIVEEKTLATGDEKNDQITDLNTVKPKKCLFVELNEDVSYFNMSTFYLVQFSYVSAFTFIDACQDHLLESDIYNIAKDKVGTVNGDILLFDTLYLIAFIYVYGAFHDIFGRKILIVFGFLSMALSLFLFCRR